MQAKLRIKDPQIAQTGAEPQIKQISTDFTDYIKGSSGFGVGSTRESGAKPSRLLPVLDHKMVQENSPGL
jgi:hypothetical protein